MTEPIEATLYKRNPAGKWLHLDGFDILPGATPRIGDAVTLHGSRWRVVDVIWHYEAVGEDASVGRKVSINLDLEAE
jgi:hypothetical protein